MRVVALEPGDVFDNQSAGAGSSGAQLSAWYLKIVLGDYGIDAP